MNQRPTAPRDEAELLRRARRLAGRSVEWVASSIGLTTPPDLKRHKGWLGQVVEIALGADGGSYDGPDFSALGIELKTIPVNAEAVPRESTWVCVAALDGSMATRWEHSRPEAKLRRVLWVPILTAPDDQLAARRLAMPMLWTPSEEEEATLRSDWEEIASVIRAGHLDRLDARTGEALHLRPKAANNRELVAALDADGNWTETNPRGFYLRRSFTTRILRNGLGWGG